MGTASRCTWRGNWSQPCRSGCCGSGPIMVTIPARACTSTAATTRPRPAICWSSSASTATKGQPAPIQAGGRWPVAGGRSSEPTCDSTAMASCARCTDNVCPAVLRIRYGASGQPREQSGDSPGRRSGFVGDPAAQQQKLRPESRNITWSICPARRARLRAWRRRLQSNPGSTADRWRSSMAPVRLPRWCGSLRTRYPRS